MLESCWGGTSIKRWSSASVLQKCLASQPHELALNTLQGGDLWNGMIVPLLKFPIRGAVWYQGEADVGIADK